MLKKIFGKNLKYYRERKGWTQEKLAEEIDVSPQYISRLETGKHSPSLDLIEYMAYVLEVEAAVLFEIKHQKNTCISKKI